MAFLPLDGPAVYTNLSVSTAVEVKVGASPLTERKVITIQPIDGNVFMGYDSSVTINNGTKIFRGQQYPMEVGEDLHVWIIAETGTVDVRITEVA